MDSRSALDFLRTHLPASDWDCYPPELFQQFADHALLLRETAPWCGSLDEEIFCHYVLFPRVNDEDLSFHRKLFYNALWPRIQDLPSVEEQVLEVNRWCHEQASYQAQDERTASPLTVFRCGSGRCGEESAFLVSALRSVGIPARQVYAPWWSHCDDNHAWVEALCDGRWRFLGACEPEPVLDRGWFNAAASRAMLIHSRIFGEGGSSLHGELLGREGVVRWYNQTPRYAQTRPYVFRALREGKPAPEAIFQLQVLNGAAFCTIAVLTADENGEARAALGLGDLHVLASLDGLVAEGDCQDGAVTLCLSPAEAEEAPWQDFTFRASAGREAPPPALDPALKQRRAEVLQRGNALRHARMAGFFRPVKAEWDDLLQAARGNYGEILAFLQGEDAPDRERFLRTLRDKDLRDTSWQVLEDHFAHRPPRAAGVPEEVYWPWVACPRVSLEKLTAWRSPLGRALTGWTGTPAALWDWLGEELEVRTENLYANLRWSPDQALETGGCDKKSRQILFVAALRTLGVPARLRPLDGALEVWSGGGFSPFHPEESGVLRLAWEEEPLYRQNWSLSRRTETGWQVLELWGQSQERLTLPAGDYRLVTSTRLPNGDQFASKRDFPLRPGEELSLTPRLRPCALADLLYSRELPPLPAASLDGSSLPDLLVPDDRPKLLFWLEEGCEPTEHILNELLDGQAALEALPVDVVFLLRSREALAQPTLARVLTGWPAVRVLLDDWAYDLEAVARLLALDPDAPPLSVVCDGDGRAVYGGSGYRVGMVELLARVAAHLTGQAG